ncbi:MAG TPA: ATP-dependent endonuclease, partial [Flavobacterium sp.]|nr:ATP-dependent endonuclease [Flavobacterium sp.]
YKHLLSNFPYKPTLKQNIFFEKISDFVTQPSSNALFVLKGYAGTGKTTVISTLVAELVNVNQKYVLLAPTGRAAKVISNYSNKPAFTIHKKIYFPKKRSGGGVEFTLQANKHTNT